MTSDRARQYRPSSLRLAVRASLVIAAFLLIFIVAELGLRWFGRQGRFADEPTPDFTRPRILCIGHSFTFGTGAPAGQSFPDQLQVLLSEQGLEVQVLNLGRGGWNTAQILRHLPRWMRLYQPQVVLIWAGESNFYNKLGLHHPRQRGYETWYEGLRVGRAIDLWRHGLGRGLLANFHMRTPHYLIDTDLHGFERSMAWAGMLEPGWTDPMVFGPHLLKSVAQALESGLRSPLANDQHRSLFAATLAHLLSADSAQASRDRAEALQRLARGRWEDVSFKPQPHIALALGLKSAQLQAKRGESTTEISQTLDDLWAQLRSQLPSQLPRPHQLGFEDSHLRAWVIERHTPSGLSPSQSQQQLEVLRSEAPFLSVFHSLHPTAESLASLIELNPYSDYHITLSDISARQAQARQTPPDSAAQAELRLIMNRVENWRDSLPQYYKLATSVDAENSIEIGIEEIVRQVREAGALPIVQLYHPYKFLASNDQVSKPARSDRQMHLRENPVNTQLRAVVDRLKVESVDPRPQLAQLLQAHSLRDVYSSELGDEDQHLTALGYGGVAQSALEVLLQHRAALGETRAQPDKK
ncbi:MAG TPA: hypothetical protein PLZ57_01245 [Pseudobdellovibrionaceae bacterium]|nr:hypothetical protein [Pseudobdellovibrionaceae bacterium]